MTVHRVAAMLTRLALGLCLLAGHGVAQDRVDEPSRPVTPTNGAPTASPPLPVPTTTLEKTPTAIQYLPDGKGGVVAVPADATIEQFLEWHRQRRQQNPQTVGVPNAAVTAIDLDGEADDQMVTLKGRLTIQAAGQQFPLPFALGLGEAVFRRAEMKGPGQVIFGGRDRDRGYIWWLEKPGDYELNCELTVPLIKSSPWRRLQLSVPSSPVTSLRLQVPSGSVVVKAAEDVIQSSRSLDGQRSEIRAAGFGGKTELLSWQATNPVTEGPAGLDVSSSIAVRSTNDAFVLEATQFVRALQGNFREFTVRLPSRGELLHADGTEISETKVDETDPERVTVMLKSPTTGPVSVRWQVRVPHLSRRNFDLDGFQVEGARREAGEVGLLAAEGFRWNVADGSDPHIERMNAGEFRSGAGRSTAVRAFRFFSQPFRLPTTLDPVEPYFDVTTLFALSAAEKEIGLEARFKVRVYRGQLPELSLIWPGWRTEGWILEGTQPRGGTIITNVTTDDEAGQGRIVVTLAERLADDTFEWRLLARRPRESDDESALTLPRVLAPIGAPTRIVLLSDENVESHLIPRGETILRPFVAAASLPESTVFPEEKRPQDFRLDTEERSFLVGVKAQAQQIAVTSEITGAITSRRLELRQRLLHRVQYARLNEIKVSVPSAIAERVSFLLGDNPQVPQWNDGAAGREKIATIRLPEPALGEVALDAKWSLAIPKDLLQDQETALPLMALRSLAGPTTRQSLQMDQPVWLDLSLVEPTWKVEHADDDKILWSSTEASDAITLRLKPAATVRGADLVAQKVIARVQVDRAGVQHGRFEIQLRAPSRQVHVQLPRNAVAATFLWNDVPLPADSVMEIPEGSAHFSLLIPESVTPATSAELTIAYRLPTGRTLHWASSQQLSVPVLPQCRWMADIAWEVSIPSDQHLFAYPDSATPWFHWERSGVIWRRVSPVLLSTSSRTGMGEAVASASHAYVFGQFGSLTPFPIRSLSTSAALLWGAGLPLLIGFALRKTSRLTAIVVGSTLALGLLVAGLWLMPQIELLFQPMLLGLLFPLMASVLAWWKQRPVFQEVLTIDATPSDLRSRSGSMPPTQSLRPVTGDSATVYRPQIANEPPVRIAAESHLG